jgi:hypothetical protein
MENTPEDLISQLAPLKTLAYAKLKEGIDAGNITFIKLWFEYFYGRPGQLPETQVDNNDPVKVMLLSNGTMIEI